MTDKTPDEEKRDKRNHDKIMRRLLKIGETPVICVCSHVPKISKFERDICKLLKKRPRNPKHVIREGDKSVKCVACGRHWCCDECAIEQDAIPGFLNQWRGFPRRISPENKNIRLVTCLKCKHWEPKE
jgi:hypothetical protein